MGDELNGEVNQSAIKFAIFTRAWDPTINDFVPSALKASKGPDGKMRLHGIASSTVKDLHGDTMLQSAVEDMERAANQNLTIFGNHSYDVPEDVYGSVEQAVMKQAGTVDGEGNPVWDLNFDVVVNEENERAVKTWKAIDNGTKLGMSIGAMIPEGGATRNKKSGAYTIAHVELLETSIVGIPANPRSWIQNAVKSIRDVAKGVSTVPLGAPELTLDTDAGTYQISGSLTDIGLVTVRNKNGDEFGVGENEIPEDAVLFSKHEACGESIEGSFPDGLCSKCGATGPFLAEWVVKDADLPASATPIETTAVPEVTDAATCPDCGRSDDGKGCHNPYHSKADSVEPEVTDAKVTLIEIDTGDSSGSSASEPEGSDDDDEIEMAASVEETVKAVESVTQGLDAPIAGTIQSLLDLTNGLLGELTKSKTAERNALAAKAAAEQDRDETVRTAGALINQTNALIQRLGDLRMGPKTLVTEAADELDDIRGIYSDAFLDMLKGNVK